MRAGRNTCARQLLAAVDFCRYIIIVNVIYQCTCIRGVTWNAGSMQGASATTPQRVKAYISSGNLRAFGRDIALPIKGTGEFEVLYCDGSVRVFRSSGSLAVQVRADKL